MLFCKCNVHDAFLRIQGKIKKWVGVWGKPAKEAKLTVSMRKVHLGEKRMYCQILQDYITGKDVPNTGPEEQRQAVEKFLVEEKGCPKEAVRVDFPLTLHLGEEVHDTKLDLVVFAGDIPLMVVKCVAGSLDSWVRETVAAARILTPSHQLPFAVVSDGVTALVHDGISGKILGEGLAAIPSWKALCAWAAENPSVPLPADRVHRQKLVFRTYDILNQEAHSCGGKR